jgi:hypothetical protein
MELIRSTWRQVDSVIVEYFQSQGGEILADRGESYLIINDEEAISSSNLARNLMDPTS